VLITSSQLERFAGWGASYGKQLQITFGVLFIHSSSAESNVSTGFDLESHCTMDITSYGTFLSFLALFWNKINDCDIATPTEQHGTEKDMLVGEAWGRPLDLLPPTAWGSLHHFRMGSTQLLAYWAPELGQQQKWAH